MVLTDKGLIIFTTYQYVVKPIAVKKIPNRGLGKTINDRLKRASKF